MLDISRPGISSEDITEYPIATRFIKLPIKNYLKLLPAKDPVTLLPSTVWDQINGPQIALINAINDPRFRFVCAALSRRLGKTYIANIIAQLIQLVPGCNVLIMSPNFSLSSISFELQRNLIGAFELEVERDNLKDKVIELSNGSSVRMGRSLLWIVVLVVLIISLYLMKLHYRLEGKKHSISAYDQHLIDQDRKLSSSARPEVKTTGLASFSNVAIPTNFPTGVQ